MSKKRDRWNTARFRWRSQAPYGAVYWKVGGARLYASELKDAKVGEVIHIDSRRFEVAELTKTQNSRPGVVLVRVDREDER